MELDGRVAVVSGGGSGIGAACATRLSRDGVTVATWDLVGGNVRCDVRDPASVEAALAATVDRVGVPSVLVAAAGVAGRPAVFHEIEVDDFDGTLAVNLRGVFLTMRAVTHAMRVAGLDGSVVAVTSVNGLIVDPRQAAYSTAKAGVNHLCRVAASDLGPYGIRVNAVAPGPTLTPMLDGLTADPDYVAEVASVTPLARIGTPDLVADAVVALLRADWITGQVVAADGGIGLQTARGRWRLPHADRSPHARPVEVR